MLNSKKALVKYINIHELGHTTNVLFWTIRKKSELYQIVIVYVFEKTQAAFTSSRSVCRKYVLTT